MMAIVLKGESPVFDQLLLTAVQIIDEEQAQRILTPLIYFPPCKALFFSHFSRHLAMVWLRNPAYVGFLRFFSRFVFIDFCSNPLMEQV